MRHLAFATALLLLAVGCSPPPDPVEMGTLCYSASNPAGCSTEVTLERGTVLGRNALDYRIRNTSDVTVRARVLAGPSELFEDIADAGIVSDMSINPTNPSTVDPRTLNGAVLRLPTLEAGEEFTDRLLPSELGRDASIRVQLGCTPTTSCELDMEYVLVVEPVECTAKEDCPSGWECDTDKGLCAECIAGEQEDNCTDDQTCQLGRCTPPQQTSCQSAPGDAPAAPSLMLLVMLIGIVFSRASAGRGDERPRAPRLLAVMLTVAVVLLGGQSQALAAEPRAELSIGAGPRFFTGEVGAQTSRGLGISVGQELRVKYFGAGIDLSAATFVARPVEESAPPYLRSFLTHSVMIGPHAYIPLWRDVELTLDVSYERLGLAANSLVGLTGLELGRHGGAASGRVRYTFAPIIAQLEVGYHLYPGFPGDMVSVTLMFGVTDF